MTAAAILTETVIVIENPRGYAPALLARLERALEEHAPARPDPRHPQTFLIDRGGDHFYIAPLPTGKIVLLAHWR